MGVRLVVRSSWTRRTGAAEARFDFDQARIVVGRSNGADVQLPHPAVSNTHATVRADGPRYVLVDEDSTNGCRVNGKRVVAGRPKPIRDGDVIEIGGFTLRVELGVVAASTSARQTAEVARLLIRDALDPDGAGRVAPPRLQILNGERQGDALELPPSPASVILGRGDECDLTVPDADASREHVEIVRDHGGVTARDLESKNGLLINGVPAVEARLRDRDELQIGETVVVFEDPARKALAELTALPDEKCDELPTPVTTEPEVEPEPVEPVSPEPEASEPAEAQLLEAPRPSSAPADMLVYVLAGTVLALSIAGLVWLLQG